VGKIEGKMLKKGLAEELTESGKINRCAEF
jgi:hypothetical protein